MLSKQLAYGLALTAGLALTSMASAADDVISLAKPNTTADDVLTLGGTKADLDADVIATRYYGGYRGGYHGGYRGGYYGGYRGAYYGGYRGGYYGGYRGAYYGGYRAYYGGYRGYYGGYRPYYGAYYRPYYYGATYYAPSYSYYSYTVPYCDSYYGISDVGGASVSPICVKPRQPAAVYDYPAPQQYSSPQQQPTYRQPSAPEQSAPQVMPRAEETFPYDGGPKNPVPMPESLPQTPEDARPTVIPFSKLAPDETLVSLKPKQTEEKKTGKWNYPAYGEKPTRGSK